LEAFRSIFLSKFNGHCICTVKRQAPGSNTLDVLPGGWDSGVVSHGKSIEANAVRNTARGNSGILQSSVNLPLRGGSVPARAAVGSSAVGRASHEAGGTLAFVGPVAERVTRGVGKGTVGGASGLVGGVRSGEAKGTLGVDEDSLATGNHDVLKKSVTVGT
jgi:hypothetical protein